MTAQEMKEEVGRYSQDTEPDSNKQARPRTEVLAAICERFSITVMYAFGSRSREALAWTKGEIGSMARTPSDLDIGVLPRIGLRLGPREKVDLAIDLEDLFDVGRVDLVVLPEAPPFLASTIIQGERLYAADEDDADEYDLYILRRAGDLLPFHRERIGLILGGDE
ncbi:nucleotidyltransferase domain-containing protein [Desulfonatronum parangueonense]